MTGGDRGIAEHTRPLCEPVRRRACIGYYKPRRPMLVGATEEWDSIRRSRGSESPSHPVIDVSAPVARSWSEQVAMLKSAPVEVLEPLVLRILNDAMWSGRPLTSSQVGEMLAELLHAVPYEVGLKLAKRLEAEEGVCIIHR